MQRTSGVQAILRCVTTIGLPEDREAARKLEKDGVTLDPLAGWRIGIVAFVGVAAVAALALGESLEFAGAILAGGALLVTYVEWMLGRRESSIDKFYERLEIANEHRSSPALAGMRMPETERYVFTELDNLEYVIERYRFGYMSPSLARRGVNTFFSRLGIGGFKDELSRVMKDDCAYNRRTCDVVRKLIERHDERARAVASAAQVA